jgi:signal transduction histidine kinase
MVTICVQDFGIGINKTLVNKVFDRFFRVNEPLLNTFPGLGLGLYIASEIVRKLDGNIWATSQKGKGSTFCFSIQLKMRQLISHRRKKIIKPPNKGIALLQTYR